MEQLTDSTPFFRRKRYLVVFMAFLGMFSSYTMRVSMSVAIVALTENRTVINDDGSTTYEQYFNWSSQEKGFVLSAFFYGYMITQIPGGTLASKIGGHWTFGFGLLGSTIMTLLTPLMCYQGLGFVIAVRVLQGLCDGFGYPSLNAVYAKYIPPIERSRTVSYGTSGVFVGMIVGNVMSGLISEALGWEWIFYTYGIITAVWSVFWFSIVKSGPDNDNCMTQGERNYIKESIAIQSGNKTDVTSPPWRAILTSMPVIAIAATHFAVNWGFYTILTQLPLYMSEILNFDLTQSGALSAIPYLAQTVIVSFSGILADWIQKKNILTTTQVRKTFNTISLGPQIIFILIGAFVPNTPTIIVCISLAMGVGVLSVSGYVTNTLDIAPQFGSIIMGLSNTIATLPGIVSPILSGYIASTPNQQEYTIIFVITGVISMCGMTFYLLFASGEVQPWAVENSPYEEKTEKDARKEKKVNFTP